MAGLPEVVTKEWQDHEGAAIFTTVDGQGLPNSVYVSCTKFYDDHRIVIIDNYFNKTRANISTGSKGAFLFITKEGKAYQVKGSIDYQTSGEIYDDMIKWSDSKHPRVAAAVLNVEEVYTGAEKLF
ncbi:pyridoxamine 5'-phosphate oxidase family protein [Planctomycetota bacterium]